MPHCHQCGKLMEQGADYCTECGAAAHADARPASAEAIPATDTRPVAAVSEPAGDRPATQRIVVAALIIVAIVGMAFLFFRSLSSGPADVASKFYQSVADGRLDDAVPLLSPQIRGMIGDQKLKAALTEQARKNRSRGGLSDIKVVNIQTQGQIAWVQLELTFKDGSKEQTRDKLEKLDGKWLLSPEKDPSRSK